VSEEFNFIIDLRDKDRVAYEHNQMFFLKQNNASSGHKHRYCMNMLLDVRSFLMKDVATDCTFSYLFYS